MNFRALVLIIWSIALVAYVAQPTPQVAAMVAPGSALNGNTLTHWLGQAVSTSAAASALAHLRPDEPKARKKEKPIHGDEMSTKIAVVGGVLALSAYLAFLQIRKRRRV